ncbi:hypothetical protein GOZ78_03505 [Agrobacterium vitis]|uniref:hypothetical protein n=1 Tax=Agrobacterium vitis TaxID=373 RepID=UPI0012E72576|nr:hypothetical protein [Agrobacterium vitis]MUZ80780.1 hypothetical protein [Agrobacterium vitis]MVA09085.1 hypothetical protein [Agrobacterium vitis]
MTGPFIAGREAQPLDLLEQGVAGNGWEGLEGLFNLDGPKDELKPEDELAEFMWGLSQTAHGRKMFEWMMDISIRQPLRITGATIEQSALMGATRQGINGFAEVILKAIAKGSQINSTRKQSQNGAGS